MPGTHTPSPLPSSLPESQLHSLVLKFSTSWQLPKKWNNKYLLNTLLRLYFQFLKPPWIQLPTQLSTSSLFTKPTWQTKTFRASPILLGSTPALKCSQADIPKWAGLVVSLIAPSLSLILCCDLPTACFTQEGMKKSQGSQNAVSLLNCWVSGINRDLVQWARGLHTRRGNTDPQRLQRAKNIQEVVFTSLSYSQGWKLIYSSLLLPAARLPQAVAVTRLGTRGQAQVLSLEASCPGGTARAVWLGPWKEAKTWEGEVGWNHCRKGRWPWVKSFQLASRHLSILVLGKQALEWPSAKSLQVPLQLANGFPSIFHAKALLFFFLSFR